MVEMPAVCTNPRCGATTQPAGAIVIDGNVQGLSMSGNTASCSQCGSPARIIEGRMNVQHGAIDLLAGPQWSADAIDQLRLALVRATENGDIAWEVEEISPTLGRRLKRITKGWKRSEKIALAGVILAVISIVMGTPGAINQTAELINGVLESAEQHGPPAKDALPPAVAQLNPQKDD